VELEVAGKRLTIEVESVSPWNTGEQDLER
jgi:hypothetical protein